MRRWGRKALNEAEYAERLLIARRKDFSRMLRRSSPWQRRHISSWESFKRGVAWVMLNGGIPSKVPVFRHGLLDEWPYHIALCEIVSMDPSLVLKHGRNEKAEWWVLVDRQGRYKWGKKGPRGRVQTTYRFLRRRAA